MDLSAIAATAATLAAVAVPVAVALRMDPTRAAAERRAKALGDYNFWEQRTIYYAGAAVTLRKATRYCVDGPECDGMRRMYRECWQQVGIAADNAVAAKKKLDSLQ